MSQWITRADGHGAFTAAQRWERCSDRARSFAASFFGHFPPHLPHVVAELYDQDPDQMEWLVRQKTAGNLPRA